MPEWFVKGGPVMFPLLACSFVSLVLVMERLLFWLGELLRRKPSALDAVLSLVEKGKWEEARAHTKKCRDAAARVLAAGLEDPVNSVVQAMQVAAKREAVRMERFLPMMDTLITLSPLLGILGTVTGIIHAFDLLGASAIVDPQGVTQGVAEALITTAFGLVIAIFTLIPYNYFSGKAEEALGRIEREATRLEITLARHLPPSMATRA